MSGHTSPALFRFCVRNVYARGAFSAVFAWCRDNVAVIHRDSCSEAALGLLASNLYVAGAYRPEPLKGALPIGIPRSRRTDEMHLLLRDGRDRSLC